MESNQDLHKKERVLVYVDGFNLYFGILEARYNQCKWLDLRLLSLNLLKNSQELVGVKYFTSRLNNNRYKQKRQTIYIEALPIRSIHENYNSKRVFVAFPPKRHNQTVADESRGCLTIGRKKLLDSQFPEQIQKKDGYILLKPTEWK